MALINHDGIIQTKTNTPLNFIGAGDIWAQIGDANSAILQGATLGTIIELGNRNIKASQNVEIESSLKAGFIANMPIVCLNGSNAVITDNSSVTGLYGAKTYNASTQEILSFVSGTGKITLVGALSGYFVGSIIFVSGTRFNNGFYEVLLVQADGVIIDTSPSHAGMGISIVDESGFASGLDYVGYVALAEPHYLEFDDSMGLWEFGYFEQAVSPTMRKNYKLVGLASDSAIAFSDANPNVGAVGGAAAESASAFIGLYSTGIAHVTHDNVQEAISDLSAAVTSTASWPAAVPNFTLGVANAVGVADSIVRSDATISLFIAGVPAAVVPGAGAAGVVAKAARSDHSHPVTTGAPSDIGIANAAGASAELVRKDHVHKLDVLDGPAIKTGNATIGSAVSSITVTFATPFAAALSSLSFELQNTVDATPFVMAMIITARSVSGFTVGFSGTTDTVNYVLTWTAIGQ